MLDTACLLNTLFITREEELVPIVNVPEAESGGTCGPLRGCRCGATIAAPRDNGPTPPAELLSTDVLRDCSSGLNCELKRLRPTIFVVPPEGRTSYRESGSKRTTARSCNRSFTADFGDTTNRSQFCPYVQIDQV